jgi:hypothetical protein
MLSYIQQGTGPCLGDEGAEERRGAEEEEEAVNLPAGGAAGQGHRTGEYTRGDTLAIENMNRCANELLRGFGILAAIREQGATDEIEQGAYRWREREAQQICRRAGRPDAVSERAVKRRQLEAVC